MPIRSYNVFDSFWVSIYYRAITFYYKVSVVFLIFFFFAFYFWFPIAQYLHSSVTDVHCAISKVTCLCKFYLNVFIYSLLFHFLQLIIPLWLSYSAAESVEMCMALYVSTTSCAAASVFGFILKTLDLWR